MKNNTLSEHSSLGLGLAMLSARDNVVCSSGAAPVDFCENPHSTTPSAPTPPPIDSPGWGIVEILVSSDECDAFFDSIAEEELEKELATADSISKLPVNVPANAAISVSQASEPTPVSAPTAPAFR